MPFRFVVATLIVVGIAACATETRQYVVADDGCSIHGLRVGTAEYRLCQERETEARRGGYAPAGYSQARVIHQAQARCEYEGYVQYSDRYDRCVREHYGASEN